MNQTTPSHFGIVDGYDYTLSILKSANGNPHSTRRFFLRLQESVAGEGHFIHTYRCDGNPIPSYEGEPAGVQIEGDIDTFTDMIWNNLNEDNKVSLFTRFIHVKTEKPKHGLSIKINKKESFP